MPMRELDNFDGGEIGTEPVDISLPDIFLRTNIEKNRVFLVTLCSFLSCVSLMIPRAAGVGELHNLTTNIDRPCAEQHISSIRNSLDAPPLSVTLLSAFIAICPRFPMI
jgi:hypothetical protein